MKKLILMLGASTILLASCEKKDDLKAENYNTIGTNFPTMENLFTNQINAWKNGRAPCNTAFKINCCILPEVIIRPHVFDNVIQLQNSNSNFFKIATQLDADFNTVLQNNLDANFVNLLISDEFYTKVVTNTNTYAEIKVINLGDAEDTDNAVFIKITKQ